MTATVNMVEVSHLKKRYGDFLAVDDVSFNIQRGEIFGLLGPNGAGKTTTIHTMAGILQTTEGNIRIADFDSKTQSAEIKKRLGIVPQELAIYPRLTGRENLNFFGRLYGLQGAVLTERIAQMLALVGLMERAESRAETYSGGMKRRLNLASGLMHNPELLLLDEPTVGVDPQSRNHVFEGVRELNRRGLTILYTSHYMEEVEALCDRVGIMDGGKLIACDTVKNLIAQQGTATIDIGVEQENIAESTLAKLRSLPQVESVTHHAGEEQTDAQGKIQVRASRPGEALPGLVALLNESGVLLRTLNIKQPNLEDVFLALTGKTLRD